MCSWLAQGQVVINEIHYKPDVNTQHYEFIELYNAGGSVVDLSGWSFSDGVSYQFPAGKSLNAGAYLVLAQEPASVVSKYSVSAALVLGPYTGTLKNTGEKLILRDAAGEKVDEVEYQLGFPWPTVGDPVPATNPGSGCSIQLIHPSLDNSLGGSWRSAYPTPTRNNIVFSTSVPPQIRQVEHTPKEPKSGESVLITAKISDPDGVASVSLAYQPVRPGAYVAKADAAYTSWTVVTMVDNGTQGDALAGDGIYSGAIPAYKQTHRSLMRYRLTASDSKGASIQVPYSDDPQPNFAYFVYDGIPTWTGSIRPGVAAEGTYTTETMRSVPAFHLISKKQTVEKCTWFDQFNDTGHDSQDLYIGTLVYDGEVFDHVYFRPRGGVWRYAMRKNMWKISLPTGHEIQLRDNWGEKYKEKHDTVNLGACIQQGSFGYRGEQGMFEAVGWRLFELTGLEAAKSGYVQLRIIDEANEDGKLNAAHSPLTTAGTQFDGDFWGLYLLIEQTDGNFLDEHNLPDGNLYKMENGTGDLNHLGSDGPSDNSDLNTFINGYYSSPTSAWWRANVDLGRYFNYRTILEAIHHSDIAAGKNYFYYRNPLDSRWTQYAWDLDLTWSHAYEGSGDEYFREPFLANGILQNTDINIEYQNRVRELCDLLFNPDQAGLLIDETASFIYKPGKPSFVDVDRAMWDYHWVMADAAYPTYSNVAPWDNKAGQGRFYQAAATTDFAGMVKIMQDWVTSRSDWMLSNLAADSSIPARPEIASTSPASFPLNDLTFASSAFSDPNGDGTFGAMQWRIAEVEPFSQAWDTLNPGSTGDVTRNYLVDDGETWKYFPGTAEPSPTDIKAWRAKGFDDSAWASGAAPIGYDPAVTMGTALDMRNLYTTFYMRKTFNVADPSKVTTLQLEGLVDDGVNIWINGTRVAALNVAGEDLANTDIANGTAENNSFISLTMLEQPQLVAGANTIAVQVLNMSLTGSSDCFLDLRLYYDVDNSTPVPPRPELPLAKPLQYEAKPVWQSPEITTFNSSIAIPPEGLKVGNTYRARVRHKDNTGRWSHWSMPVQFQAGESLTSATLADHLRLTEMMYNPGDVNPDMEYVELHNSSTTSTLDLSGAKFTSGIDFTFPLGTTMTANSYLVVTRTDPTNNFASFRQFYGLDASVPVVGPYLGRLNNEGETVTLRTAAGGTDLFSFSYGVADNWPERANGQGSSLEVSDPVQTPLTEYGHASNWRASTDVMGSPGRAGTPPVASVVVNEVLTHTDLPLTDSIELFNPTGGTVDMSGWWLSDSSANFYKFPIPSGTTLAAGGYKVYDENDFNPASPPAGQEAFRLDSAHGDRLSLIKPDGAKRLFVDWVSFDAAANGESFGRWPNGSGILYPMVSRSFEGTNSGPRVGPVIISELHYNPGTAANADDLEFVEICNPTGTSVNLANWRLSDGVSFTFPLTGVELAPYGVLVVVPFDPLNALDAQKLADFRTAYGITEAVRLLGPFKGQLSNGGECVRLERPDEPPLDEPTFIPYLLEDEVRYNDKAPWPVLADGGTTQDPHGRSLTRLAAKIWGHDPVNWTAATPTPGTTLFSEGTVAPKIVSTPAGNALIGQVYTYMLSATGTPDPVFSIEGLPSWLLFDGVKTLSGTPMDDHLGSTGPITVRAINSAGQDTQTFSIQVTVEPVSFKDPTIWVVY
jgi:hypothetical protein